MRTTIELTTSQRTRLVELAAQRGERGFSRIIQEAVDLYLQGAANQTSRIREAQAVLGTMDEEGAESLRQAFLTSRASWR